MTTWSSLMRALVVGLLLTTGPAMVVATQASCQRCRGGSDQQPEPTPVVLAGMEAIPSDVQVVIGADVKRLRESWLINRAIEQMFRRDPELATRIRELWDVCKIDPGKDLDSILIALGPGAGRDSSTTPRADQQATDAAVAADAGAASAASVVMDQALMVVTGKFVEAELAACVGERLAADGGRLTFETVAGRTFYHATGKQDVWFTLPGPSTVVVATSSSWLARAVGDGDKLTASRPMAALLARIDRNAGAWAVGLIDEQIGKGLVEQTAGEVAAPPRAMFVDLDPNNGLRIALGAEMSSEKDANYLVSLIKKQLAIGRWALERYGLDRLVQKLEVNVRGSTVHLALALSEGELKEALSQIDSSKGSAQNPPKVED